VKRMLSLVRAIFLELKFLLNIASILAGCIIAPLTLRTLKRYQFHHCLFARHSNLSIINSKFAKQLKKTLFFLTT